MTYISTREELLNYKYDDKPLIGLFAHSHLEYFLERKDFEPTVEEMTAVAIEKLSKNPKGYYLFVEGGQIDFGHHGATPIHALTEYLEFDKAVGVGIQKTNPEETLLLVSADHSHVFTLGGYGTRGTDIFGLGARSATYVDWDIRNGTDDENIHLSKYFLARTLQSLLVGYANGPGYKAELHKNETTGEERCGRQKPSDTEEERANPEKYPNTLWPTSHPIDSETHGADDVALLGRGPWVRSELRRVLASS